MFVFRVLVTCDRRAAVVQQDLFASAADQHTDDGAHGSACCCSDCCAFPTAEANDAGDAARIASAIERETRRYRLVNRVTKRSAAVKPNLEFDGKVPPVTGGTSGIGPRTESRLDLD